jgi:hypothetical protein
MDRSRLVGYQQTLPVTRHCHTGHERASRQITIKSNLLNDNKIDEVESKRLGNTPFGREARVVKWLHE